jgi:hypothetical protein
MPHDDVFQILNDPLTQELLRSNIPARLAYTGRDGAPRAIPIAFHWTWQEFVICTPPHVLLVRGTASVEVVDGVPSEYLAGSKKIVGEEGFPAFEEQVRTLYLKMARITIVPEWAKLLDFKARLPRAVEQLVNR